MEMLETVDKATTADTAPVSMDVERIMQMIPHRYPFLMIDRIVDVVADKSAVGIKNVSINEYFFQGHFPRQAVMPGVLLTGMSLPMPPLRR